ncbi:ParB N-terminal domain-containing protein [Streptomyces sp. 4.24]|uniref:ParB N-terminal domain-containing protein n=1 Tax=Streptomyces tritrimontium TaxID=3406573 RepID=UPI003BB7A781
MKTTSPAAAMTLNVADLAAFNPLPQDADITALAKDIAENGIVEPLYVAHTESGSIRVVDGIRRLAAAVTLSLTEVPVTYRPLISVSTLSAHPGNVRKDLKLTAEFVKSVEVEGVRTPIQVTRIEGGQLRVVDGHRRLAAAAKAKLTHVPYTYEERDEAGQVLDMVTTARHRAGLSKSEEASALFEAAALGADAKRLAAAAGTTLVHARKVKALSTSQNVRTVAATGVDLDDLAILADLETTDPAAAAHAMAQMEANPHANHGWIIRRARTETNRRRSQEAHRTLLEAAGARLRNVDELRESATRVRSLPGVTEEDHAASCQGHVWVMEEDQDAYVPYCSNPALFGHEPAAAPAAMGKPSAAERRSIVEGNKDWDTAEEIRREWLAALFGRARRAKAVTDRMTQITAGVLLAGGEVLTRRSAHPSTRARLCQWLGLPQFTSGQGRAAAVTKAPVNAATYAFASVAAAYEQHAVRTAWRTDGDHAEAAIRAEVSEYLSWLVDLGYQPAAIEQAVIDRVPYNQGVAAVEADQASGNTLS